MIGAKLVQQVITPRIVAGKGSRPLARQAAAFVASTVPERCSLFGGFRLPQAVSWKVLRYLEGLKIFREGLHQLFRKFSLRLQLDMFISLAAALDVSNLVFQKHGMNG
jgi:hypothetical protein